MVYGAVCGLGGRDTTPDDLMGAVRRALADHAAGVLRRPDDWLTLQL